MRRLPFRAASFFCPYPRIIRLHKAESTIPKGRQG